MKGIVFTEFLELVEQKFSFEVADRIIEASDLPSGGIYTSVGTYPHLELLNLVEQLSKESGIAMPDLVRSFGEHLFSRFASIYPQLFEGVENVFDFLASIENYIHVEVQKLYPDAELPCFEHCFPAPDRMELTYYSSRALPDLAEGLIRGGIQYFGECVDVVREDVPSEVGATTRFVLVRSARASQ
jgi:hypothetical protein